MLHPEFDLAASAARCNHRLMRSAERLRPFEWIFGYGSLMWRPNFEFVERRRALLPGYRRAICIYSRHHRGTNEQPGLVCGLDAGGDCMGIAFRIRASDRQKIVDYLDEREMVGYAYRPAVVDIDIGGTTVAAYTFVADPAHAHYAGSMGIEQAARIILNASGRSGLNRDYLLSTVEKLDREGLSDPELTRLLARVKELTGELDQGGGI